MPRPRLSNVIEHIPGTESRYLFMDVLEGTVQARVLQPDSPEWFAWLAQLPSFHFKGKSGHFTARSEHKRHRNYWYAYRKEHRQIYKRYVGTTDKLTLVSLEQTARNLHEEALRNLPENELRTTLPQKETSQGMTLGELTFRWDDGVLVVKTPSERHFLNKAQSADLLGYLYDQRVAFLKKEREVTPMKCSYVTPLSRTLVRKSRPSPHSFSASVFSKQKSEKKFTAYCFEDISSMFSERVLSSNFRYRTFINTFYKYCLVLG